tara:strand:- start:881 stop:1573 length:693 start_codon:yes stop_codon:yes gene_type:complete
MALGGKTSGEIHDKTGGDLAAMVAKYDANAHHSFIGFDEVDVMLHQMQLMQDDIDELRRFVDSASELRGKISPLPIANGGTGLTASQPLIYSEITIDASEMASLHTTRKTLVAAQGANTMIVPVSCMIRATKLNSGANNTTLANVSVGYGDDIRDLNTLPIMSSKGLLFRRTTGGTLHVAPTGGTTGDISVASDADCVNVELAMCTSADVGVNGASASKVSLLYYVATTS